MEDEQNEDMRAIEPTTAVITAACIIAGVVLIVTGHEAWGGVLLSFATGAAVTRPLVRRDR